MSDLRVETVPADDLAAFSRAVRVTFLEDPATESEAMLDWRRRSYTRSRWRGVRDGERYVGTLRSFGTRFTVPGWDGATLDVPANAVSAVTVAATHRRRGLLRAMISQDLAEAHERGDAISILESAEWPIYGRFGYAPASRWAECTIATRRPGARLIDENPSGSLHEVDADQMRDLASGIYPKVRAARASSIELFELDWERLYSPQMRRPNVPDPCRIVHRDEAGTVDGYLAWTPSAGFDLDKGGSVRVTWLLATTGESQRALWNYLLNFDVVDEVLIENIAVDDPIRLQLVDGRALRMKALDAIWVRLLDVPTALSGRGYAAEGRLAFEVIDDDPGGYAAGRYLLDVDDGVARCTRTNTVSPQLRLSQRALAGVYLGDSSLRLQQAAGLVDELTPGAVQRADLLLHTDVAPWPITGF